MHLCLYSNAAILLSFLRSTSAQSAVHIITITAYPSTCSTPTAWPTYAWVYTNGTTIPYTFTNNGTSSPSSGAASSSAGVGGSDTISSAAGALASGGSRTSQRGQSVSANGGAPLSSSVASNENSGGTILSSISASDRSSEANNPGSINSSGGTIDGGGSNVSTSNTVQRSPSQATSMAPSRTTTGSGSASITGGNLQPPSAYSGIASTIPLPTITFAPSLACPSPQAAFGYEEPTSGDEYQVQCDTVFAGRLLDTLSTRDMDSCLSSCSANDDCVAAGFDADTSTCSLYSAVAPGTSTLSPKVQFAQLKVRAVVTGGTTSSVTIATFDFPVTSFAATSSPSALTTSLGITTSDSPPETGPITELILAGTALLPGSSAVISGTTYSLPTNPSVLHINSQTFALPTASPGYIGSPLTLPNGVVATSTTVLTMPSSTLPDAAPITQLVIAGTTLAPGSTAIIADTTYSYPTSGGAIYVDGTSYSLPASSGSPLTLPNGVVATPTAAPGVTSSLRPQISGITSLILPGTTLLPGSIAVISGTSYSFPTSGGAVFIDGTPFTLPTAVGTPVTLPNGVLATPTVGSANPSVTNGPSMMFRTTSVTDVIVAGSTIAPGSTAVVSGTTYSLPISGNSIFVDGQPYPLPTGSSGSLVTLANGAIVTLFAMRNIIIGSATFTPTSATELVVAGTTLAPGFSAVISGTTYSFPASGNTLYIDGVPFTLNNISPGSPLTLPNGVEATPTDLPDWVIGSQTLTPGGSAVIVGGTTYSLSGSQAVVVGPSTTFTGDLSAPTDAVATSAGSVVASPGGTLIAPTGLQTTTTPASTASDSSVSGMQFATSSQSSSTRTRTRLSVTALSSTTFLTGGSVVSTTIQGITTSYIANATTVIAPMTNDLTSALPSPTNPVADAEIGQCPGLDGLLAQNDGAQDAKLVSCGKVYEGTVLMNATQVGGDVDGCSALCDQISDCVALSATDDGCNIYTYITGITPSTKPAFSALKLNFVQNSGMTTILDGADLAPLTESLSLTNATLISTNTLGSIGDSSIDLAATSILNGTGGPLSNPTVSQTGGSIVLSLTSVGLASDVSSLLSGVTSSGSSVAAASSSGPASGWTTSNPSSTGPAVTSSISGVSQASPLLPSLTGGLSTSALPSLSLSNGIPSLLSSLPTGASVSTPNGAGSISIASISGVPQLPSSVSGVTIALPSSSILTRSGSSSSTTMASGLLPLPSLSTPTMPTNLQPSVSNVLSGSISGIVTPTIPSGGSLLSPTSNIQLSTSSSGASTNSPQNAGQSLLPSSLPLGPGQFSSVLTLNTVLASGLLSTTSPEPSLSHRPSSSSAQIGSTQVAGASQQSASTSAASLASSPLQPVAPSSSTAPISQSGASTASSTQLQASSLSSSQASTASATSGSSGDSLSASQISTVPSASQPGSTSGPAGPSSGGITDPSTSPTATQSQLVPSMTLPLNANPTLSVTDLLTGTTLGFLTATILPAGPSISTLSTQLPNPLGGLSVSGSTGQSTSTGSASLSTQGSSTSGSIGSMVSSVSRSSLSSASASIPLGSTSSASTYSATASMSSMPTSSVFSSSGSTFSISSASTSSAPTSLAWSSQVSSSSLPTSSFTTTSASTALSPSTSSPSTTSLASSSTSRAIVSVQSAASLLTTQSSSTASALPTAACNGGSSTYASGSGSDFLISCDFDYYVESLSTVSASSFTDCTNLCSADLQCMGATWDATSQQCNLGSQMTPTNARIGVRAALRMTPPRSLQSFSQTAANGGFDGDTLSPWYNSEQDTLPADPSTYTGPQISVVNGAAQASFPLSQQSNDGSGFPPSFQVRLVQNFRIPQGYFYFLLADVAVSSQGDTSCGVSFAAENSGLPSLFLNAGESYVGSVNGSGTMAYAESTYVFVTASCQGHSNATVRIDNVMLNIWQSNDGSATASTSIASPSVVLSVALSTSSGATAGTGSALTLSSGPSSTGSSSATMESISSPESPTTLGSTTLSQSSLSIVSVGTQAMTSTTSSFLIQTTSNLTFGTQAASSTVTSSDISSPLSFTSSGLDSTTSTAAVATSTASFVATSSSTVMSTTMASSSAGYSSLQSSASDSTTTSGTSTPQTPSTGALSTSSTTGQSSSSAGDQLPSSTASQSTPLTAVQTISTSSDSLTGTPSSTRSTVLATLFSLTSSSSPAPTSSSAMLASSQSSSSASSTSSALAVPTLACPQSDGSTYTGQDGSTYLIVCNQAYETAGIGILPQTTLNLTACIDLCVNQGTACQGVTWKPSTNECSLKGYMSPTVNVAVQVYSAVRMTGPLINGLRNNVNRIVNGVFDTALNPWVPTVTGLVGALTGLVNSLLFMLVNGVASVGIPLSLGLGQPVLFLTETLSIAANQAWYLQADVFLINAQVSTTTSCTIYFRTDQEILWQYYYDRCSQQGTINGSGIVTKAATQFYTQTACTGTTDVSIGFDHIIWSLYPLAVGLNPIILTAVQVLTNNDFAAGTLAPWVWQAGSTVNTAVTVNTAKALQVAYSLTTATANVLNPCSIVQTLPLVRAGQTYRLQASVSVTIASTVGVIGMGARTATCYIILGAYWWTTKTTAASSTFPVDVSGIAASDYTNFTMFANCYGTATATVTFDNIFLTRDVTLF